MLTAASNSVMRFLKFANFSAAESLFDCVDFLDLDGVDTGVMGFGVWSFDGITFVDGDLGVFDPWFSTSDFDNVSSLEVDVVEYLDINLMVSAILLSFLVNFAELTHISPMNKKAILYVTLFSSF